MKDYRQAIKIIMLPRDTNALGSIFGGHILSNIDLAAAEHAQSVAKRKFVTKVFREVNFLEPVFVGDTVSFYTKTVRTGRTSITVEVQVVATRMQYSNDTEVHVTSAEVVMVAVDDNRRPIDLF
jgi:acyl-CoA thioesterase YciA